MEVLRGMEENNILTDDRSLICPSGISIPNTKRRLKKEFVTRPGVLRVKLVVLVNGLEGPEDSHVK